MTSSTTRVVGNRRRVGLEGHREVLANVGPAVLEREGLACPEVPDLAPRGGRRQVPAALEERADRRRGPASTAPGGSPPGRAGASGRPAPRPRATSRPARAPTTSITMCTVAPSRTTRQNDPSRRAHARSPSRSYSRARAPRPASSRPLPVVSAPSMTRISPSTWNQRSVPGRLPPRRRPVDRPDPAAGRLGEPRHLAAGQRPARRQPRERQVGRRRVAQDAELQLHPRRRLRPRAACDGRDSARPHTDRASTTGSSSPIDRRDPEERRRDRATPNTASASQLDQQPAGDDARPGDHGHDRRRNDRGADGQRRARGRSGRSSNAGSAWASRRAKNVTTIVEATDDERAMPATPSQAPKATSRIDVEDDVRDPAREQDRPGCGARCGRRRGRARSSGSRSAARTPRRPAPSRRRPRGRTRRGRRRPRRRPGRPPR